MSSVFIQELFLELFPEFGRNVNFVTRMKFLLNSMYYDWPCDCFLIAAIAQEKTEEELKSGIEQFNKDQLRHQKTEEKNPLPDKNGKLQSSRTQHLPLPLYLPPPRCSFP